MYVMYTLMYVVNRLVNVAFVIPYKIFHYDDGLYVDITTTTTKHYGNFPAAFRSLGLNEIMVVGVNNVNLLNILCKTEN